MRLAAVLIVSALSFRALGKETPPAGSAPKPFTLAATDDFTLPNGMKVTLAHYGVVPKVAVRAYVDAGAVREPENKIWLSRLTAQMVKEGTATRSSEQIASEAADMGGELEVDASEEATQAGGLVLSDYGSQFVALLGDVLSHASLPSSELPRLKADLARQLAVEKAQPRSLARERFFAVMYPNQPYGRTLPSESTITGFVLDDVQKFYNENFTASRTHLYVVGKFDPSIKEAIRQAFSTWKSGQSAPTPPANAARQYSLQAIDRPGAAQSTVYMGLPVPGPKSPDYVTLDVMNSLLGGSFGSRITSNIREAKGYTYSPFSNIGEAGRDSYWAEIADVTTAVTGPSLHEIFAEVNRLRKDPPSADELKGIQNYLSGLFVLKNTISPDAVISQLHFVDSQELDRSFLFNYVQKVDAVAPPDIQRVTESYITPSKMTVVVVGDKSKIADQLKTYEAAPQ